MAIRYLNPADIFRQMEMEMFRQNDSSIGAVFFQPCVDMYETDVALVIKMELAGIRPNRLQIELSADDRSLSISGERSEGSEEHRDRIRCHHLEIFFGTFQREISLPSSVPFDREAITAKYKDGFLVVFLPKAEAKSTEKRTIQITKELVEDGSFKPMREKRKHKQEL